MRYLLLTALALCLPACDGCSDKKEETPVAAVAPTEPAKVVAAPAPPAPAGGAQVSPEDALRQTAAQEQERVRQKASPTRMFESKELMFNGKRVIMHSPKRLLGGPVRPIVPAPAPAP